MRMLGIRCPGSLVESVQGNAGYGKGVVSQIGTGSEKHATVPTARDTEQAVPRRVVLT